MARRFLQCPDHTGTGGYRQAWRGVDKTATFRSRVRLLARCQLQALMVVPLALETPPPATIVTSAEACGCATRAS